jgi:Ser/Thr protein kinase RdoA (MazF antagonist)
MPGGCDRTFDSVPSHPMLRTLADALRPQALLDFELPLAPPRVDELHARLPSAEELRVYAPAGPMLVLISASSPLTLAYEVALFDLLAESGFPSPAPRRSRGGALLAQLRGPSGPAAAACYGWPAGSALEPTLASTPQLLEVGRLLARLHIEGVYHPARVADPCGAEVLLSRLPSSAEGELVAEALRRPLGTLPTGAVHGRPLPEQFLFVGDHVASLVPSGTACTAQLLLDLAEALVGWALPRNEPMPALRALISGYQSLRRLNRAERDSLPTMIEHAAARSDARAMIARRPSRGCLAAVRELPEDELRGCT